MANGRLLVESRVGVLGSGEVGRRLAAGFRGRDHDVMIGSRDPAKAELREWLSVDGAVATVQQRYVVGGTPGPWFRAGARDGIVHLQSWLDGHGAGT